MVLEVVVPLCAGLADTAVPKLTRRFTVSRTGRMQRWQLTYRAVVAAFFGSKYSKQNLARAHCGCRSSAFVLQEVITIRRYQLDIHELWSAVRQQGGYKTVSTHTNIRSTEAAAAVGECMYVTSSRRTQHSPENHQRG
jgi:hypothetical protein